MPRETFADTALVNLDALLESKGNLIKAAFGIEDVGYTLTEEGITFAWFNGEITAETSRAYADFVSKICEMARRQKRVTAKAKDVEKASELETKALLNSGNWGQSTKANKYWTVYSDRSHNTTYNSASTSSGKCDELNFNEEVRIAKIEGDFALVYTEKKKGVIFPLISSEAQSRGWIPMKNLLLWNSCPTDDAGIYQKALIVLNIDGVKNNNGEIGRRYMNPATKDSPMKVVSDMRFYFVMKQGDNGLVLLAKECKMDGYTSEVLYGWVNKNSFVPWSQRTCIEPNWKPSVAEELKGTRVNVYRDGAKATDIPFI